MVGTSGRSNQRSGPVRASAQGAGLDLLMRRGERGRADLRIAREQRLHAERRTAVRDLDQGKLAQDGEALARQVRRGTRSRIGEVHAAGRGAGARDQLVQAADGRGRAGEKDVGRGGELGDRREVADRVVAGIAEEAGIHHEAAGRHEQRVAVGRRARGEHGADIAAGTTAILDHHRLAQRRREPVGEDARHDVGGPARTEGHHDAQRAAGPGLREGGGGDQGRQREQRPARHAGA
jgi:hypothetical protein